MMLFSLLLLSATFNAVVSLDVSPFKSVNWVADTEHENSKHNFVVALQLRNRDGLAAKFQDVSNPKSKSYGKYLSMDNIQKMYAPAEADVNEVRNYFSGIPGSHVELNLKGDMLRVSARLLDIEEYLGTKIMWHKHANDATKKRSLRAVDPLSQIPSSVVSKIAFTSLNSPINHMAPHAPSENINNGKMYSSSAESFNIGVKAGNNEATITFKPVCQDGSINTANPPCVNIDAQAVPYYVTVTEHADGEDPYQLTTDPKEFTLDNEDIFCYNSNTKKACQGAGETGTCTCMAKLSPLPKYTRLRARVTALTMTASIDLGVTPLFVTTDVATLSFLSELYNIPAGLHVTHPEATQAVAEFYGEYYSNADLQQFLHLSGVPSAGINASTNVIGYNDESHPGGEAQLDVEYLMGLAPGADTFFYSIADLNPYNSDNEGFLTWLYIVGNQVR